MNSEPTRAVFLSYASQDAEAAKRICDALRAAGVEVWFDQNELVGGDAWDQKIRKQIAECALFVPIISANTQARGEGYFRIEWRLAAQRTHAMADDTTFLLPVVIDGTRDSEARVPAEFKAVQWTHLPEGVAPAGFVTRLKKLLEGGAVGVGPARPDAPATAKPDRRKTRWAGYGWAGVGVLFALIYALRPMLQESRTMHDRVSAATSKPEAQRLVAQAKALIDLEPLTTRETYRTAYELCDNAAKISPDDAEVWATMARANAVLVGLYREGGEPRVAATRSQAEKALQLSPDSIEAGLAMSLVDLDLLQTDPATVRARLERLLQRAPNDHRILLLLAQTEDQDVVSEVAFRWLAQAEAVPGGKAHAALRQAWIYWGANRLRDSLAAVERSLAVQPLTEAYHLKLMLHCTMGDNETALRWLKQIPPAILREDRPASIAYETYYFGRQPDEALRVLRAIPREIFEEGRYFEIRSLLAGEALLMAGKPRAAEVEFRTALKVIEERLVTEPRNSRLWHAKGRAQCHLGDRTAAENSFTTARELGGNRLIDLAIQHQMLGQSDEALILADQSLDRNLTRWPSWLYYLKNNPAFDSLRSDVRFRQLIARGDSWLAEELGVKGGKSATSAPLAGVQAVDDKSVAVLAFANLSDDKANEYFSDGISEELLNVLAKVPGLKVSARTSAFYFKGKDVPIPEIAKQLGVAYVVEGSVRKSGDKVRITAQLIKAADGFHVWSDTFTRDLKDIFAVQDEIAGLVAKNLSLKLGVAADPKLRSTSPEAYQLYLQARQAWNLRTSEGHKLAESLLLRAIAIEPGFAKAHAALCDVWTTAQRLNERLGAYAQRESVSLKQAIAKAEQAIQLDPNCAEAYAALGNAFGMAWRMEDAVRSLQRAVELNPNYATAHQWLGRRLSESGDLPGAYAALVRAAELDPLSHRILDNASDPALLLGRLDEAMSLLQRAAVLNPASVQVRCKVAFLLWTSGRRAEAVAAARALTAEVEAENREYRFSIAAIILGSTGHAAEADQALARMTPFQDDHLLSLAYLGRRSEVIAHLDNLQLDGLHWFLLDPRLTALRLSPEFKAWTTRVGAADALSRANAWLATNSMNLPSTP